MAFTNITTELEELISKCEFENKQYVRAISQETQLLENINQEITFKNGEMVSLQSAIVQTEKETSHFERQCEYHITNIENLKKTNDVLTEHIHAMKTKFEDVKAKRHEEKCSQDRQLQYFRDKWEEYKEAYEKFPLAVKLKKIQDEIRCSEENTERAKQAVENMKESIKKVENEKYWNSMDWKTFVIKLAENRLLAMRLKNEIEEIQNKKKNIESDNLQRLELDTQDQELSSENNIKKMKELHIPEDNQANDEINNKHMEVCSPMISVLSDKDDDQTELMQTDETNGGLRDYIQGEIQRDRIDSTPAEPNRILQHQQPKIRNQFQEDSILNQLFPRPKEDKDVGIPNERPNQREMSKMQTSPSLPFVSYSKASHNNDGLEEKVDLHLNTSTNKASPVSVPQKPYTSPPLSIPKINQASVQRASSSNRPNQLSIRVPTPQPCKIPSRPPQVTQSTPRKGPFPVPILSHNMPSISPSVRGSRSSNFQPSIPVLNRPGSLSRTPTPSTTSVPKLSPSVQSLSQPSVQNRSYFPLSNVPRVESRSVMTHGNKPQASVQVFASQSQHGSMNVGKQHQSDRIEDTVSKPAMLKEQTIKVLQSLKQQSSPYPCVTQDEMKNKTESTASIQLQPIVPCPQNQPISSDVNPKTTSSSQNMPDDNVYHLPLKDSPQKPTQYPDSNSPHKSPGKRKPSKSNSPFSIEKHRQKLEELKNSPGYPEYVAQRRMFQSEVSVTNDQVVHAGGDTRTEQNPTKAPINTALFGGASQPSGDDCFTATPLQPSASEGNFNLFTNFMDSPGQNASHFISFGQDDQEKSDSPYFSFNFDQKETEQSPDDGFSFFDKRNTAASPPSFNFNFDAPENRFDKGNTMSLFEVDTSGGEKSNKSDGFFKLNFSKNDDSDSFCSSFGNADGKKKSFSLFGSPSRSLGQEKPTFLFGGVDNAKESSELEGSFKLNLDQNEKGGDDMLSLLFGRGSDSEKGYEKPTFLFNTSDKESDKRQDFSFFNKFESNKIGDGSFNLFGSKERNNSE